MLIYLAQFSQDRHTIFPPKQLVCIQSLLMAKASANAVVQKSSLSHLILVKEIPAVEDEGGSFHDDV